MAAHRRCSMDSLPPDLLIQKIANQRSMHVIMLLAKVNRKLRAVLHARLKEWVLEIQTIRRGLHLYGEGLVLKYHDLGDTQHRTLKANANGSHTLQSYQWLYTTVRDSPSDGVRVHLEALNPLMGPFDDLRIAATIHTPMRGDLDVRYSKSRKHYHMRVAYIRGIPAALVALGVV